MTSGRGPALSVEGLGKRFGDRVAFEDVSFEIAHGEVFGFLGPNGAGKTTTVRTLGTLIAPSAGSAAVAGIPLAPENGVAIRRRIAIMPETPGVYECLSVEENLRCFADLYEVSDPPAWIERALHAVNLTDRADDPCATLQRAATHRLEEAERLCDRVAILNTTLRTIGRPQELRDRLFAGALTVKTVAPLAQPDSVFGGLPAVQSYRADGDGVYRVSVSDAAVAAPAITRALVAAEADVLSIGEAQHSLQDVYFELIDEDAEVAAR